MQFFQKSSIFHDIISKNMSEDYNQYLNSIIELLPKELVRYYNESYSEHKHNRFHDCIVKELSLLGKSGIYENTNDEIRLVLVLGGEIEYILTFSKIYLINISLKDQNYFMDNFSVFGEILDCKIGVFNENYIMEFCTSTGVEFFLEFKKVRCSKKIKK